MISQPSVPSEVPSEVPSDVPARLPTPESEGAQIRENIEAVLEFYAREEEKVGGPQRAMEQLSLVIGQPIFMGVIVALVLLWILLNVALIRSGVRPFDPPPFSWLQGVIGFGGLLIATAVLAKQNRLAKLAEQRAHLDLKVILLTEQKTAKLIDLIEELRRDLPNVRNRHDSEAAVLQKSMTPGRVLDALNERAE
jgi:uncharacterized membrane protein